MINPFKKQKPSVDRIPMELNNDVKEAVTKLIFDLREQIIREYVNGFEEVLRNRIHDNHHIDVQSCYRMGEDSDSPQLFAHVRLIDLSENQND